MPTSGQYAPNVGPGGMLVPATQPVATMASTTPVAATKAPTFQDFLNALSPQQKQTMTQQLTQPADTSGQENNAASKAGPAPTTNTTSSSQPAFSLSGMNPLAMNLMYSQAIAPMMQSLGQQLMSANAGFAQQASDNPMAKYMPPQFQAFFKNQNANMAQQQNDITASLMSAAQNAPAVDAFMNQINAGRQQAATDYEKFLYSQAAGGANPFTSTPGSTSGTSTAAQQAIQDAIKQAANSSSASKTPDPNHPGYYTDGTPIQ